MRRRDVITILGTAAAWPLAAHAQQRAMPVVGVLNSGAAAPFARMIAAFDQGLSEQGYVVGRNVRTELRWADGQYDRLPDLAAELARLPVGVLASPGGDVATVASMAATKTIPIVFMVGRNPVKAGFVARLNRPGGNATGLNILTSELAAKRLELLRDLVPNIGLIGVLVNPNNPNAATAPRTCRTPPLRSACSSPSCKRARRTRSLRRSRASPRRSSRRCWSTPIPTISVVAINWQSWRRVMPCRRSIRCASMSRPEA
jgi:ABC-type uncharacterized transport system substrate-binding protein